MQPNPGHLPPEAVGKRIRGVLRNGMRFGFEPVANAVPLGWAASDKGACNWRLTGSAFDIVQWEVIG